MNTSIAALISIADIRGKLKRRVFVAIKERGWEGATCDELEESLDLKHQTLSARVRELWKEGFLRKHGERRTRSGRWATVYRARKVRKKPGVCMCDSATCSRFPCKQLREYRITHRVVSEIVKTDEFGVKTIKSLLGHIESECEILVK